MLKVEGLTRQGLEPVDLELEAGEIVAVLGPSGSGKTLLLRAIADLDPNQGAASLDGADRSATPAPEWRRRVGYLAAESGWWAERVGVHFADTQAAGALAERLGLPKAAMEWEVARLSTGERQRLALVRLLLNAPDVLLLDEPTSGLDDAAVEKVEELLEEHRAAGAAMLFATHDKDQARRLARRCLRLAAGRAVEEVL